MLPSFQSFWPSGVFAFLAALLLLPDTGYVQRVQMGALMLIGVGMVLYGDHRGASIDWPSVLAQNTGLLSMVISVGLLKVLMARRLTHADKLPTGRKAYWQTLLSLGIFGSVINISAPILISDRLTLNRPMDHFTAATVSRVFCACSTWSPFFAGTAVVLTAVTGSEVLPLMVHGLPLLMTVVVAQYAIAHFRHAEKLKQFRGYPIRLDSLWVPLLLAVLVMLVSLFFSHLSILICITLVAILLTLTMLSIQSGVRAMLRSLLRFITEELPRSVNELQLFLSAGVLAAGLKAIVQIGAVSPPLAHFDASAAALLLAFMIVVAGLGIHPVIQIAALTPLILEVDPDPTLLGLTYMFAWGLGTCASPLSGTHLILQGRYGMSAWRGALQNWPFVAVMYCAAVLFLWICGSSGG